MYPLSAQTERLLIRKLELQDVGQWESFFENNPALPYLGLNLNPDKKAQANDWIQRQLWRYANNKYGHHALIEKKSGRLVGQCGLLLQEINGAEATEVGYSLLPQFWGKGYATEAATFFRNYAFENNVCQDLIAIIHTQNAASQKVAGKLGMKKTLQTTYHGMEVFVYTVYPGPNIKK